MRDLIDIIESKKTIAEAATRDRLLYEAIDAFLKEGPLDEGRGGKIGLFKAAAAGIGLAAAMKILSSMAGGQEGYYGPIGAGIDPNDDFVPRVADFGPNLFPRDPQKPGGPAPDHEDFWD